MEKVFLGAGFCLLGVLLAAYFLIEGEGLAAKSCNNFGSFVHEKVKYECHKAQP